MFNCDALAAFNLSMKVVTQLLKLHILHPVTES